MLTVAMPSAFCQAEGNLDTVIAKLDELTATNERAVYCIDGLRWLSEAERLLHEDSDPALKNKVARWRLVYEQENGVAALTKALDSEAFTVAIEARVHAYYREQWQQVEEITARATEAMRGTATLDELQTVIQGLWAELSAVPDKAAVVDSWARAVEAAAKEMDDDLTVLLNAPRLQHDLPAITLPHWNAAVARDADDKDWTAQVDTEYRNAYDEAWREAITEGLAEEDAQVVLTAHEAALVALENSKPQVTSEELTAIVHAAMRTWQGMSAQLSVAENEVLTARQEAQKTLDDWVQSKAFDKLDEEGKQQAAMLVQTGKQTVATCTTVDEVQEALDWYVGRLHALEDTTPQTNSPWLWVAVAALVIAVVAVAIWGVLKWRKENKSTDKRTEQNALALLEQWKQEALRKQAEEANTVSSEDSGAVEDNADTPHDMENEAKENGDNTPSSESNMSAIEKVDATSDEERHIDRDTDTGIEKEKAVDRDVDIDSGDSTDK